MRSVPTQAPGRSWSGEHRYSAGTLHRPRTMAELQRVVASARHIRALGTRHCFNDIGDSRGDLVTVADLPTEIELGRAAVRVSAGTRYGVLAERLHAAGHALGAMASLPHISVAGAVATATHGSGDRTQNLAASVRALELVGSDGDLRRVERGDPELNGSVVALGALGVVTHVELDVEPTYLMRQDVYTGLSFEALESRLDEVTSAAHSVSVFTDWTGTSTQQVWLKTRVDDRTPEPAQTFLDARRSTVPLHPLREGDPGHATEQLGAGGPWHERLPHFRLSFTPSAGAELQAEYLVARRHAPAAIGALRGLGPRIAPLLHVAEIRTVAADDLWLSTAYGRDTVALHFTFRQLPEEVAGALADIEAALDGLDARPHWGKLFRTGADALEARYPRYAEARSLVARHDPHRTFANAFTDRIGLTRT